MSLDTFSLTNEHFFFIPFQNEYAIEPSECKMAELKMPPSKPRHSGTRIMRHIWADSSACAVAVLWGPGARAITTIISGFKLTLESQ